MKPKSRKLGFMKPKFDENNKRNLAEMVRALLEMQTEIRNAITTKLEQL